MSNPVIACTNIWPSANQKRRPQNVEVRNVETFATSPRHRAQNATRSLI